MEIYVYILTIMFLLFETLVLVLKTKKELLWNETKSLVIGCSILTVLHVLLFLPDVITTSCLEVNFKSTLFMAMCWITCGVNLITKKYLS